jgi:hypothetical protein
MHIRVNAVHKGVQVDCEQIDAMRLKAKVANQQQTLEHIFGPHAGGVSEPSLFGLQTCSYLSSSIP